MCDRKYKQKKENDLLVTSQSLKKKVIQRIIKSKKTIKLILILVIIVATHGYLVKLNSPQSIANKYFISIMNQDENKLHKLMNVKEGKFTTVKMLKKVLKNNSVNDKNREILKHKVKETKYNDNNKNASVVVEYLVKGLNKTQRMTIELNKLKTKKWLIYDNWKASTNKYSIARDFEIKVQSGSVVEIENIKLDKTYLNKKKTTKKEDIYKIPEMFTGKYKIKIEQPDGIKTEELVNINTKSSYSPSLSSQILEENSEKKLSKQALKDLQIIYNAAIDNKPFSIIKSKFEYKGCNLEKLEKSYNQFKNDLSKDNVLIDIDFKEAVVGSIYTTEDKTLNVSVTAKSKYTVEYKEKEKKKKHSDKASDYVSLYYKIINNEYKLTDVKYLETYFSRY